MFHVYKTVCFYAFVVQFVVFSLKGFRHRALRARTHINVLRKNCKLLSLVEVRTALRSWMLPFSVFGHSCVDYEGKLILIGGYNANHGI